MQHVARDHGVKHRLTQQGDLPGLSPDDIFSGGFSRIFPRKFALRSKLGGYPPSCSFVVSK
jgi:hypothetical protein